MLEVVFSQSFYGYMLYAAFAKSEDISCLPLSLSVGDIQARNTKDFIEIGRNQAFQQLLFSIQEEEQKRELQDLLLNKFNQFIKENKILKMSFDKKLSLKLLALILYLNESIIRIIDNFDFVFSIPKIVIYLNGEDTINEWMVILLCYLHNIGIDIVIFNPSGSFNINKYIKEDKIVINRLEEIRYDCKFDEIINYKQSFFSRIMNK